MFFELKEREAFYFIHLIYLGNHLINGNSKEEDLLIDYVYLTDKLIGQYLNNTEVAGGTDKDIDDFKEVIAERVEILIKRYEETSLPYTLARMIADYKYPFKDYESLEADKNMLMEQLYEEVLEREGMAAVHIHLPELEQMMSVILPKQPKGAEL